MTKMKANHLAILKNKSEMITNKVILDVDTGTRVLAVWAAKAGAKRLYAVDDSNLAQLPR
ncbi:MAG: 50S ribosomal protein L11 methyltransferase [Trichodesmium sp. St19_bin1]|nr:50S ribosomal protein L11 methyltransferase [Trichodesmium sp. St2_bin2_1]MDE5119222.1 50S ribosomal protein L11 methyltransferase [Trichodesmium sp. St19_bin1]